jgi:hypothetical protein
VKENHPIRADLGQKGNTHKTPSLFRQPSIFGLVPAARSSPLFRSLSLFLCVYVLAMPEKKKEKRMGAANRDF